MREPVYSKIEDSARPTLFAANGFILLAAVGLWASALIDLALPLKSSLVLANALYYLPFVALPIALYARKRPGLSDAMRLNPLPVLPTLSVALLALISVYAASALAALWEIPLEALGLRSTVSIALPQTRRELAISIVGMAALPAVCEELLFRGFALSAWESRGTWFAAGVTSALFALLHGNLFGLPAYLLVGAISAFVTFALNSLYAGIVYHTIYNAACLTLPYLLIRENAAEPVPLDGAQLLMLIVETAAMFALMAMLLATLRMRAKLNGIEPVPRIYRPVERRDRVMLWTAVAVMLASAIILIALSGAATGGGA